MAYKIFVSHAPEDQDLAEDLVARLRHLSEDADDVSIVVSKGKVWRKFSLTVAALEKADAVMILITPTAFAGPYVFLCLGAAVSQRKRVVPINVGVDPATFPAWLRQLRPVRYADLNAYLLDLPRRVRSGEGVGETVWAARAAEG